MRPSFPIDGISSRAVFWAYTAAVGPFGLWTTIWGPGLLGGALTGVPWGAAPLFRIAGASLIGAACCAIGCARIGDPRDQRRALGAFAGAHIIVYLTVVQQSSSLQPTGASSWTLRAGSLVTLVLLYAWLRTNGDPDTTRSPVISLLRPRPASTAALRSQYEQQIRAMAAQEERNRLGRDLHDSIKQEIFVIQTAAATAEARLQSDEGGVVAALTQIRDSARDAMSEVDALTEGLHATPLENTGLVAALRRQCDALALRTGAHVDVSIDDLPPSQMLPPGAHQAIFRAAQEALANVARHARASHVRVALGASGDRLVLRVTDDGGGYDQAAAPTRGMGLDNMRARAAEFDGSFDITSRPGGGTTVAFAVPVTQVSADDFRRKAWWAAGGIAIMLVLAFLARDRNTYAWVFVLTGALDLFRYLLAWARARRVQAQAA